MNHNHAKCKCPICGKESVPQYTPFCSKKCADIDLGRWLKGSYIIHTNESPTPEDLERENTALEEKY